MRKKQSFNVRFLLCFALILSLLMGFALSVSAESLKPSARIEAPLSFRVYEELEGGEAKARERRLDEPKSEINQKSQADMEADEDALEDEIEIIYPPDFFDSGQYDSVLDSGIPPDGNIPPMPTLEENVNRIRLLLEFVIYSLLPIAIAIIAVFAGCVWFYKTWVDSAF